ncbi:hypothetical protein ACOMHN_059352 [Nucella lapillus]
MAADRKMQEKETPTQTPFPCSSGVTMPQLGAKECRSGTRFNRPVMGRLFLKSTPVDDSPVDKRYLKKISTGIQFEEDVVKERCFYMMPYDTKYLAEALDSSHIIAPRPKILTPTGRHNAKGTGTRHMPCKMKITKPPSLKPLKKKLGLKALAISQPVMCGTSSSKDSISTQRSDLSKTAQKTTEVFMTEVSDAPGTSQLPDDLQAMQGKLKALRKVAETEDQKRPKSASRYIHAEHPQNNWDTFLMSHLSKLTATWIVHECMSPSRHKEELQKTLEGWYGKPRHIDLVQEEGSDSDTDFDPIGKDKKVKKKKWKKPEKSLLERVYARSKPPQKAEAIDPYSDDNKAPFYRQPAGIRRQKKLSKKVEADVQEKMKLNAINATALQIKVKSVKPPKTPTLREFMPKGVGSTLYDTENQYEQELLAGVPQMHPSKGDGLILVMASNQQYKKMLRHEYPGAAEKWYPATEKEKEEMKKHGQLQPIKREYGAKRWRSLPEPYDATFEKQKLVPPGFNSQFSLSFSPEARQRVKQNTALLQILHEWRQKWNLSCHYADASFDDIIRDMADIQPHVRLKAIATVGRAMDYKPPSEQGIRIGTQSHGNDAVSIPECVFLALDILVEDPNGQVQRAAAITLYALEHPTEKAQKIMRATLESKALAERWAAAQCLAHFGVCDFHVVNEIIKQILSSEDPIKHEKGIALLAKLSINTTLVHCMVAEQLNSSSWRNRVIACKILPTLYGTINNDVKNKLTDLMWHDWHTEVRNVAGQCLGKTLHGRHVHDDIRRCIMYGNERTKLAAVSRLGQLGIMTAKMLPVFLQCFEDPYISIRSECCITCGNLKIKEESIIDKLIHLATYDPTWKVKALAIQALGKVGLVNESIKEILVWAMRYDEDEAVRAEACHAMVLLDIMDDDVVRILQDRLLVESSQVVRDEIMDAMQMVGVNATEDMDMVAQIKGEVRKLCNKNVIASQIVLHEDDEMREQNLRKMFFLSQDELERIHPKRNFLLKMLGEQDYKEYLREQRKHSNELRTFAKLENNRKKSALKHLCAMTEGTDTQPTADMLAKYLEDEDSSTMSRTTTLDHHSRDIITLETFLSREDAFSMPPRDSSTTSCHVALETEVSGTYIPLESTSRNSRRSLLEKKTEGLDRQLSIATVQETLNLPLSLTPGRSRLGLTPSATELESRPSLSQSVSRHSVVLLEPLRQRKKVSISNSRTYAGLTARYEDTFDHLPRVDEGLKVAAKCSSKYLLVPGTSSSQHSAEPTWDSATETDTSG